MRRLGIRALIVGLIFGGMLPGLLAGSLILVEFWRAETGAVRIHLLETVRALKVALDHEIAAIEDELTMLARSDGMQSGDFAMAFRRAREMLDGTEGWIALVDPSGREIFNTKRPFGTSLGANEDMATVQRVVETRRPAVSNVFVSDLVDLPVVAAAVPVLRDGEVRYVLEFAVPAARAASILQQLKLPPGWIGFILDRSGMMIARYPALQSEAVGEAGLDHAGRLPAADEGAAFDTTLQGAPITGEYASSASTGWKVGVGVPTDALQAPFRRSLFEIVGVTAMLALGGALLAWRVGRRFMRSIASLSLAAEALEVDPRPLPHAAGVREIEDVGAALAEAARLLKRRSAERDAALAALRTANETLEERVEERTLVLADTNRRLSAEMERRQRAETALKQKWKMEVVGRLTGGVAHDFNNLLTAVIGNLDRIVHDSLPDAQRRRHAQAALNAAERGGRLTERLLAFSGQQLLQPELVRLDDIVARTLSLSASAIGEAITVTLVSPTHLWMSRVDPVQFELALLNVLMNARDAMPAGGRVRTELANRVVAAGEVPDLAPGDYVLTKVSDAGIGMPPDVLAQAFEPYFTTKDVGQGSGLGLSMVYGFARQSGGTVRIESTPDVGTTVYLYLPRASEPTGEAG